MFEKTNKKTNIKDLAKKLNLSVSSVSRALNGHKNISEKTREKILKLAKKYNYVPDPSARRLASKKSDTIAFITTIVPSAPDFVLLEFLTGISMGIKDSSTEFIVKFTLSEKDEINYYEKLIRTNQADKFVFYRTKKIDPRITMLKKNNINFVSWGREKNEKGYAWIDMDNEKSVEILVKRLIKFGHRKIALINVHQSFNYGYQRKISYERTLKENNISLDKNYYQESLLGSTNNGVKLTRKLLSLKKPPTAIICSLDKFFIGSLQECENQKLNVGKDISIVGYNDYDIFLSTKNLTYVSHPIAQMGIDSVNILNKLENGYNPEEVSVLIQPILHEGKSDGPLVK
jgi:LacI family transcriptional regulator